MKFYTANLALALNHLHQNKILHRDLKPENILVDEDGYLQITDYGTSTFIIGQADTNTFTGTRLYNSPEMLLGTGHNKPNDW